VGALDGKVAVITGAASGIGLASARRLHAAGAAIVAADRNEATLAAAADELDARPVAGDVGDPATWERIVATAAEAGGIDFCHLNAGTAIGRADIGALGDEEYRRIMAVNFDGVVFGARAVVPTMAAAGGGAIVATASLAGVIAFPGDPIYTATKHAVVGLVRSLAPTLRPQHITINAVCPSLVDTPLIDGEIRQVLAGSGFPLISADEVAVVVYDLLVGENTGKAVVVQAGVPATPFRFGRPPAPEDPAAVANAVPENWLA